jgi:hypothetical protein
MGNVDVKMGLLSIIGSVIGVEVKRESSDNDGPI